MKTYAFIAASALLSSTIISTPAFASTGIVISPDAVTEPDETMMQQYCEGQYDEDDTHYVEAIERNVVPGAIQEVANSREDIEETRVADTSSNIIGYGGLQTVSDPLVRTGGSPNLWGAATFSERTFDRSLVDQTAEFSHRDAYNFDCRYWTLTITTRPAGNPGSGNPGLGNCVGDPNKKSAIDGVGPGKGAQNSNPNSACHDGGVEYVHNWSKVDTRYTFYFTPDAVRDFAEAGVSSDVDFTETGGSFSPPNVYALACISPGSKKGSWRAKAAYTGGNCSTATFNAAPTVRGHVFDEISSNSLPTN